jgi:hypothetical protein
MGQYSGVLAIVAGHPLCAYSNEGLPNLQGRGRGMQQGAASSKRYQHAPGVRLGASKIPAR